MDKELPTWLGKGEITGNPEVLLPWVWESRPTLKLASAAFNRGWATLYLHSWWLAHLWLWPLPSCSGPLKTETLLLEVKDTVPNNCQSLNRNTWKLALPTFSEWGRILYLNSKFFVQLLLWAAVPPKPLLWAWLWWVLSLRHGCSTWNRRFRYQQASTEYAH